MGEAKRRGPREVRVLEGIDKEKQRRIVEEKERQEYQRQRLEYLRQNPKARETNKLLTAALAIAASSLITKG